MWMSTTHVARLPKRGQSTDSPLFQAPRDGDRYNGVEPTPLVPSISHGGTTEQEQGYADCLFRRYERDCGSDGG